MPSRWPPRAELTPLLFDSGADGARARALRHDRRVAVHRRQHQSGRARGSRQPLGLAGFGVLGLLNGFLPAWTDRIGFWTIDGEALRWLGVALFAVGGCLRLWPVVVLGDRFSGLVAIQPGHTLVTGGVYGVLRHPSYLGLFLNSFGWSLAFRAGVGVLVTALLIPPIIARIYAEEALLRSQFGAEYDAFRAKTKWRLILRGVVAPHTARCPG